MEKRDLYEKINNNLKLIDIDLHRLNETLSNNFFKISNRKFSLKFGILTGLIVFSLGTIQFLKKYDKAIVVNGDNAVIFDVTSGYFFMPVNDNVIYVDEDKGISANDIAISLVGEDGIVTYYNSETDEKVLINK